MASTFYMIQHTFAAGKVEQWWANTMAVMQDESKYAEMINNHHKHGFHNHTFMPVNHQGPAYCIWEAKPGCDAAAMQNFIDGPNSPAGQGYMINKVEEINLELTGGQTPYPRFYKNSELLGRTRKFLEYVGSGRALEFMGDDTNFGADFKIGVGPMEMNRDVLTKSFGDVYKSFPDWTFLDTRDPVVNDDGSVETRVISRGTSNEVAFSPAPEFPPVCKPGVEAENHPEMIRFYGDSEGRMIKMEAYPDPSFEGENKGHYGPLGFYKQLGGQVLEMASPPADDTETKIDRLFTIAGGYHDTSMYEVRTYYHRSKADFDNFDLESYNEWVDKFFKMSSHMLDVTNFYRRIAGSESVTHPGPGYQGEVKPTGFETKYPDSVQAIQWTIRWDNKEHADRTWGKIFSSDEIMAHVQKHPFVDKENKGFVRMESRFMTAIAPPQRSFSSKKVYEVRNYTVDTDVAAWNEENRHRLGEFIAKLQKHPVFKGAIKVVSWHLAQSDPMHAVVNGSELVGGEKYDQSLVTPAQVTWVAEWDSREQAAETWGKMLSDPAAIDQLCKECGENPWWQVGKPLFGYKTMDSVWMVNGHKNFEE